MFFEFSRLGHRIRVKNSRSAEIPIDVGILNFVLGLNMRAYAIIETRALMVFRYRAEQHKI